MSKLAEKICKSNGATKASRPCLAANSDHGLPALGVTAELLAELVPSLPTPKTTRIVHLS
jgi:hypothetical protein